MADQQVRRNFAAERKTMQQNLTAIIEEQRRECNHKPSKDGKIIPLHESNAQVPGKDNMPETTVLCTRCGAPFESSSFSPEEAASGIYMFTSMLHQTKLNAQLTEEDKEQIALCFSALDQLSQFVVYYNDMVKKLANGNSGGGKNRGNSKGHMGMSHGMMNGRGY